MEWRRMTNLLPLADRVRVSGVQRLLPVFRTDVVQAICTVMVYGQLAFDQTIHLGSGVTGGLKEFHEVFWLLRHLSAPKTLQSDAILGYIVRLSPICCNCQPSDMLANRYRWWLVAIGRTCSTSMSPLFPDPSTFTACDVASVKPSQSLGALR